jgi:hypothetical protein
LLGGLFIVVFPGLKFCSGPASFGLRQSECPEFENESG